MATPDPTDFEAERRRLASDPFRPAYHFVAPSQWLNDPNGCVYWQGRYHLFYQYAPGFTAGNLVKHWGHAVSEDLVHWQDLPVALSPTPGSYDAQGIWSGTGLHDGDRAIVIYHARYGDTGDHPGGNCIATSEDELLVTWEKHPANPVIPPDPARVYDPCLWKEGDAYYSLSGRITEGSIGDAATGGSDVAYLSRSTDLERWDDLGPFYGGGRFTDPGEDCAVPDFFALGGKHALLFASHKRGAQLYTGTYAEHRFRPETHSRLNFTRFPPGIVEGGELMAPLSWQDDQGRRIVIAWATEGRTFARQQAAGWAGVMTLPRVLSLASDGGLRFEPVPKLQRLRGCHQSLADLALERDRPVVLDGVAGDRLEIAATIEPGDAAQVGLKVRCSPDGAEETVIAFDRQQQTLTLDVSRASLSEEMIGRAAQVAPLALSPGEPLCLRVYVDRSIVEVFAGGAGDGPTRQCATKRIYPSRADSVGVSLFACGGTARVLSLDAWEMDAIWPTG